MIKVRDGYGKLIGSDYNGNIAHVLLSNGGNLQYAVGSTASTLVQRNASGQIESSVASTVAPFVISSTKVNANLNADLLDGFQATGLFQSLTSAADKNLYIKIGDTEKEVPLLYASYLGGVTKEGLFTEFTNVNDSTNPNSIKVTIGDTTKYLKVAYSDLAGKVVCSSSTNDVDRPIIVTNTSNGVYYSTKVTLNYSTGNVTAPTFTGTLIGNADTAITASKLSTVSKTAWGQTYWTSGGVPTSISGDMTGVGDITMSGSINSVLKATTSQKAALLNVSEITADINYIHLYVSSFNSTHATTRPLVLQNGYGNVGIGTPTPGYKLHVAGNTWAAGFIKQDSSDDYVLLGGGGHKLLSELGISGGPYLPLSGGTMTGPIQVGPYTSFGVSGENFYLGNPLYPLLIRSNGDAKLNGNTIWHSGNDGSGSGLDADLLDGYHRSDIINYYSATETSGFDLDNLRSGTAIVVGNWAYAGSLNVTNQPWSISAATTWTLPGGYPLQIARFYNSNDIRVRGYYSNSGWTAWKQVAFTTDIPTVTNYYWANVKVSSTSSTTTSPTFANTTINGTLTMGGVIVTQSGSSTQGIKFGTSYLNQISNQLLWQSPEAIRFGSSSWDWSSWAGLKYVHSSKTVHLGLADGTIFNANAAQGGGTLNLPGISHITSSYYKMAVGHITSHTHTTTGGWYRVAKLKSYFNYDIHISGSWSTGMPSVIKVNVCQINGTAKITQLAGYVGSIGSQIRLGKVATDEWDVLFYSPGFSSGTMAQQNFVFFGIGNITTYTTNTISTTSYTSTLDLVFKTLSGVVLTTDNYSSYLGYIGTTAVQKSSAAQALTGITNATLSGKLIFTTAGEAPSISFLNGERIDGYGNVQLGTNSASWNVFNSSRSSLITVLKSGNVGIGTTSPSAKLHVNGQVYSTGYVRSGSSDSYVLLGGGGHKAVSDFAPVSHSHSYVSTGGMVNGAYGYIPTYNGETGWHRIATIDGGVGYGSWILYLCGNWSYASNTSAIVHIDTMHTSAKITQVSGIKGYVSDIRVVNVSSNKYYVDIYINYSGANTPGTVYFYFLGNGTVTTNTTAQTITTSVTATDQITLRTGGAAYAVHDDGNKSPITFKYSSGGYTSNPSYLAAWNGYQITYVAPAYVAVGAATLASTVTVNNSDANSTYRMVWHSGNTLFSTNNIYCNPSTDQIYSAGFRHVSYNSASYLLRSDGGAAAFNWSGQSGQPTWLWGGNSLHTYYVYNPSNFNVNSAAKLRVVSCYNGTTNNDLWSTIKSSNSSYLGTSTMYEVYNDGGPTTYGHVLDTVTVHSNHWQPQLWMAAGKDGRLYYRNKDYKNDTWGNWRTVAWTSDIPSVGNGTVTIKQAGTTKGSFTMNQSGNTTIELTDNNTTYSFAPKGSAIRGIYLAGTNTFSAMTYSLGATVNAGTASKLAYYSGANAISAYTSTCGDYYQPIYLSGGVPIACYARSIGSVTWGTNCSGYIQVKQFGPIVILQGYFTKINVNQTSSTNYVFKLPTGTPSPATTVGITLSQDDGYANDRNTIIMISGQYGYCNTGYNSFNLNGWTYYFSACYMA